MRAGNVLGIFDRVGADFGRHDFDGVIAGLRIHQIIDALVINGGDLGPVLLVRGVAGRTDRNHVKDQSLGVGAGEELFRTGHLLERLAGNRIPGADGGNLSRGQRLRRLVGRRADERHVGLAHAVDLERLQQELVFHQGEFDADFFAFQILDRINTRRADDHVAAFAVIHEADDFAFRAAGAGDHVVAGHDHVGVNFAGGKGVNGRRVLEPDHFHVQAGILEPAFLFGDFHDACSRASRCIRF